MSGPARKSAAVNKMNGNPGRRPRAVKEPKFPEGEPECPDWIDKRASEHWVYAVEMMRAVPGMLTLADRDFLIQYTTAWNRFYKATDEIEANGLVVTNSTTGVQRKNPAVEIQQVAHADILRMIAKMGFDPSSRSGKQFGGGEQEIDPIQEMLNRRGSQN